MIKTEETENIIKFCSDPNMVNYCSLLMRPGLYAWMVELEYTKFKPDTDANEGFHIASSMWPFDVPKEQRMAVSIVSIDKSGQEFAEQILWKHGLKKCEPGVTMMIFGGGGNHEFFLQGPNVFWLENHSRGAENVIYTNDREKMAAAKEHDEDKQVQKFFEEHALWLSTPEGWATAQAFWNKHPEGEVR